MRRPCAIAAEEALEQPRQLRVWNAAAVVRHGEEHDVALGAGGDRAARAVTRVTDRVREKVLDEHAQDAGADGDHNVIGDERGELLSVTFRARALRFDDIVDDRRNEHVAEPDNSAAGLELAEEENVVDELGHRLDLLPRLGEQRLCVRAWQRRAVEQCVQPRERRAQLVRDRGCEADPQFLE